MILHLLWALPLLLAGPTYARTDSLVAVSSRCLTGNEYENTGPTIIVREAKGKIIPRGGRIPTKFKIELKSPVGIDSLEITKGAPLIDSERNLGNGCAAYIFTDAAEYKSSNTYHVDLGNLKPGTSIFVQAFDGQGGVTIHGFVIGGRHR